MERREDFDEWLRQRGTALDLARFELPQRASCSVSPLRKIEAEERRPSRQLTGLLVECLGIARYDRPAFVKGACGELCADRLRPSSPACVPERKPLTPLFNVPIPPIPLGRAGCRAGCVGADAPQPSMPASSGDQRGWHLQDPPDNRGGLYQRRGQVFG
jgi:hypothetical protein